MDELGEFGAVVLESVHPVLFDDHGEVGEVGEVGELGSPTLVGAVVLESVHPMLFNEHGEVGEQGGSAADACCCSRVVASMRASTPSAKAELDILDTGGKTK